MLIVCQLLYAYMACYFIRIMVAMVPDFPNFIPLSLDLKEEYNRAISTLPPYSDISFVTLQTWWSLTNKTSIALLNANLVISYHLILDPVHSGLGLIGTTDIETSVNTLFAYLEGRKEEVKLVNVPEFVIDKMTHKEKYVIKEETDFNEYLLDSAGLANLEGSQYQTLRKKIKRFKNSVNGKDIELRNLDLSLLEVQEQLLESIAAWEKAKNTGNDPDNLEHLAIKTIMEKSKALDIQSLALYINKQLHGILIYHQPPGHGYYILHHLKVNYDNPYVSDYMHHAIAKKASESNVHTLNVEMDLGIENLRQHKLTLRPKGYFKKFTVLPADNT